MSEQPTAAATPSAGTVSQDGEFRWNGSEWVPIRGAQATGSTRLMQFAFAAFFVLLPLLSVGGTFASFGRTRELVIRQLQQQGVGPAAAQSEVSTLIAVSIGFSLLLAAIYIAAAVCSLAGWNWAFWFALVLLGLTAIFSILGLVTLIFNSSQSAAPIALAWLTEVVQLVGLGLFVWGLVTAIRVGPWARRRPGAL